MGRPEGRPSDDGLSIAATIARRLELNGNEMTPEEYMREIMEPTIKDLAQNRASKRHAFLACVVTYHTIDYLCGKRRKAVLRGEYRAQSPAFAAVDRIAHGRADAQPGPKRSALRVAETPADSSAAFGEGNSEVNALGGARAVKLPGEGADILAIVNQAADFLAKKAREQATQEDQAANDTYYVVIPFHHNAQGDLEPGLAREAINAVLAQRLARALAAEHVGAIAFSRAGDPETGEFQDPVVLATFGEVDLNAVR
jgi:hypothetical protein